MRTPVVAGQFYPKSPKGLKAQLEEMLFASNEQQVLGAIVPHAGYIYSGQVAAKVYSCMTKRDTFVILGPNHRGLGSPVSLSRESWETPMGQIEPDLELADALTGTIIDWDEMAHVAEHSIEVQLPFLQARFSDFRILPISLGWQDMETAIEVGRELGKAISKTNRSCTVIASSDFSHYIPADMARKIDMSLIEAALNMDVSELYRRVQEYDASMCGYGPIAATIVAAKDIGSTKGKFLGYATSGDRTGEYSQVVGYGAVIFT